MGQWHVLVVDDEPLIRELLHTILDLENLRVTAAAGGEEGLRLVAEDRPDIVVCDVMMPDLDGLEVCRRIKADPATADLPVVLLTARDRSDDRRDGERAGCDAYLTKPFSPLHLIDVIAEMGATAATAGGAATRATARGSAAAQAGRA